MYPISPRKRWEFATSPDQRFHLPHLGLMITAYYRPQQPGVSDHNSAEHNNVRKAIKRAMEPLIKLDGGAEVHEDK